jgi:catechol 2,3-dioxygenase-like lactoylglutathione lyase family enzyme
MSIIPLPPRVDCERVHPGMAVADLLATVDFYTAKLGFTVGFTWGDPPTFAGMNLDEVQVFLSQGTPSPEGCDVFFVVGDVDQLYAFHRAAGVEVVGEIGDREYGLRDYAVRDLNGYRLTFGQYIYNFGPAIPIERVDVPVRLEKRLAALVNDLAEYKRLSVSGLLEEILLHTSEPRELPLGGEVTTSGEKNGFLRIRDVRRGTLFRHAFRRYHP